MTRKSEITIESVKSVVRQIVEQLWPDEINAFEMSFGQLRDWPRHWEHIEPTKWKVEDLLIEVTANGYAFPGTIPAETPPWFHFGLVVHAVAEHFRRLGKVPEKDDIEAVYKKLGSGAKLSTKVLDVGGPAVVELVRLSFLSRAAPPKFPPSKEYEIFVNGKRSFKGAKEVRKLHKKALDGEFDIFADDPHSEILLCGCPEQPEERRILKGETRTWKTLLALLEKPGGFWFYKELYEKVEEAAWHGIGDSRKAYQWVRHVKDIIEDTLKAWDIKKKLNVDDIFDTGSAAGRVHVSDKLKACVVRHLSVG